MAKKKIKKETSMEEHEQQMEDYQKKKAEEAQQGSDAPQYFVEEGIHANLSQTIHPSVFISTEGELFYLHISQTDFQQIPKLIRLNHGKLISFPWCGR